MGTIDWNVKVREAIIKEIARRGSDKFATTRAVWYYCGDVLRLFPRTEQTYKKLNALTVDMRLKQEIGWGYFSVVRGVDGRESSKYEEAIDFFNGWLTTFLNSAQYYSMPRWFQQNYYVEVWVEKKGLLPNVERYLSGLDVQVRALEGYPPWEFVHAKIPEITDFFDDRVEDSKIEILYLGDLDPSGVDIDRQLQEIFEEFQLDVDFHRIGLTPSLVKKYGLPTMPEPETVEKIHKDSRRFNYWKKFGMTEGVDEAYTELDAWNGINPQSMRDTIRTAVEEYYDEGIWAGLQDLKEENARELERLLKNAKKKLGK